LEFLKPLILSLISVGALPTTYDSNFYATEALPSSSGDSVYLQHNQFFYELTCSSSSCNWSIMEKQLTSPTIGAVAMYLPSGYTC
jgi:hypothetical protein